jgi:hypothetical protein
VTSSRICHFVATLVTIEPMNPDTPLQSFFLKQSLARHGLGAIRNVVGIGAAPLQRDEVIRSSGEVNWLSDGSGAERLPAVDLTHANLAAGKRHKTVCVSIRRLNSTCSRSIALVVPALRHWLGGSEAEEPVAGFVQSVDGV